MLRNMLNSAFLFLNTLNVGIFYTVSFKYAHNMQKLWRKKMFEKV